MAAAIHHRQGTKLANFVSHLPSRSPLSLSLHSILLLQLLEPLQEFSERRAALRVTAQQKEQPFRGTVNQFFSKLAVRKTVTCLSQQLSMIDDH
jgi:hypothetical protein